MNEAQKRKALEISRKKGSDRIQINNILSAVCVGVLSVLLSLSGTRLSAWMIGQLACAIPCLVTSSLAYAKTCYRKKEEYSLWDNIGWLTHSLGYIMILNAMALMLYQANYRMITWIFLGTTIFLFLAYSVVDVVAKKRRLKEKGWKLAFYLLTVFVGSILPIIMRWVD